MVLDKWIMSLPKDDRHFVAETVSEIWDVFRDLKQQHYLRATLRSKERKAFPEILRTSDGFLDAFNMLVSIPTPEGEFIPGRNKEFVEHNKKYGFSEARYVYLLLSESMSTFLRNVELFRCCFLVVLETKPKEKKRGYPFNSKMGVGELLNQLVSVCGSDGRKIKDKVDWELRNSLTHGLVWQDGFSICYSKDVSFTEKGTIRIDDLWKKARSQSEVTQCLIKIVPEWYNE